MVASGVCEDRTREPGLVGGEQPGGAVFEPVVFEFADGEFDHSVVAVEPVGFDGGEGVVADERVVAPGWPHRSLGGVSESGAAHDQPDVADLFAFPGGVDRFGDLGVT